MQPSRQSRVRSRLKVEIDDLLKRRAKAKCHIRGGTDRGQIHIERTGRRHLRQVEYRGEILRLGEHVLHGGIEAVGHALPAARGWVWRIAVILRVCLEPFCWNTR